MNIAWDLETQTLLFNDKRYTTPNESGCRATYLLGNIAIKLDNDSKGQSRKEARILERAARGCDAIYFPKLYAADTLYIETYEGGSSTHFVIAERIYRKPRRLTHKDIEKVNFLSARYKLRDVCAMQCDVGRTLTWPHLNWFISRKTNLPIIVDCGV